MKRPNFFLVGAPKCATTSVYEVLRAHRQIFMPFESGEGRWLAKEPHYFCPDLEVGADEAIRTEADYLKLFEPVGAETRIGEASVCYLLSQDAPRLIREFCGDGCKIIIGIRNPVDWIRSWHHEMISMGSETVTTLAGALDLEPERLKGQRLPPLGNWRKCLTYRRLATFSDHIERFITTFGRENVHVYTIDDLKENPEQCYAAMYQFLGVAPQPFTQEVFTNRSAELPAGFVFIKRLKLRIRRMGAIHGACRWLNRRCPAGVRKAMARIQGALPPASENKIDPDLQNQLRIEFRPEVDRLSALLGRDLSSWST